MLNQDKYKTADERVKAFGECCKNEFCNQCNHLDCKLHKQGSTILKCYDGWLALEAEDEKPENCPFCGGECHVESTPSYADVVCDDDNCEYRSCSRPTREEAVSAHNRVARAVMAAKEGEVK